MAANYRTAVRNRETAGFRSKLEARWSIFFDEAGIPWEYESRFLRVPGGRRGAGINYLPDFWLPDAGQWAEVKGSPQEEMPRILAIARGIGDLVILGNVPAIPSRTFPVQLHGHADGRLFAVAWDPYTPGCPFPCVRIPEAAITAELLLRGFPAPPPAWAVHPLTRARAAFPNADLYGTG
jgi:hypothetical protein